MIPKDPMILLSYVNTQLRDYYDSLEALCTCRGLKKDELVAKMHSIDYEYDEATNQFIYEICEMLSDSGNCCWGAFFVLHIRKLPALIAQK